MNLPLQLFDFEGLWELDRRVQDDLSGQVIAASGQARLYPAEGGLIYDEEVKLRVPGQAKMTGTRRYYWRDSGDQIAIHFDDQRFFHSLKLGAKDASDHHDCAPDSYDAVYDFSNWPLWTVCWTVSGPRKSYRMRTEYRPHASNPLAVAL